MVTPPSSISYTELVVTVYLNKTFLITVALTTKGIEQFNDYKFMSQLNRIIAPSLATQILFVGSHVIYILYTKHKN